MNTLTVQTASTLTQAADIDSNLLYLPIQIESDRAEQPREILALLDTGAQASILSRAIVDELRLSTHKIATPVKVQSAKDDRSVIIRDACHLDFRITGTDVRAQEEFLILDAHAALKMQIDFYERRISIPSSTHPGRRQQFPVAMMFPRGLSQCRHAMP
ncbi:hypothetical protein GUITHDRAFT_120321 [Guillardia theta CCMP2712]|uniref:Peptidase A2 domain-containing protein n=1 Tax=Guillardia theta (strain CCMP2712) TaxID=905079 RepID=L1IC61_GUITC|nr:hypothetical protein GUITHDRAFT_120321 [Guillardia theta CCMP2712]EKX33519.1 hypothetical protein GUITHDRAFT_120321 [Guillardia theta CCMP2712]|eukprot:XP_005820499.1 hypothetical protein GUITHDRAFT_120321 [Guillardia theta CCMP2712]